MSETNLNELDESIKLLSTYHDRLKKEVVAIAKKLQMPTAKINSSLETTRSKEAGILEVENFLSDKLNTKVSVVSRGGKGRIVVAFADMDDLHRIYNLLYSGEE